MPLSVVSVRARSDATNGAPRASLAPRLVPAPPLLQRETAMNPRTLRIAVAAAALSIVAACGSRSRTAPRRALRKQTEPHRLRHSRHQTECRPVLDRCRYRRPARLTTTRSRGQHSPMAARSRCRSRSYGPNFQTASASTASSGLHRPRHHLVGCRRVFGTTRHHGRRRRQIRTICYRPSSSPRIQKQSSTR